ncbi:MAG: DoxX family protein [Gaiellaceae bacterium]
MEFRISRRFTVLVADVFSGVLVFAFGGAAVGKLVRQKQQVQTAAKLRIPWSRYRLIGVLEAAAAVGLLLGFASASLAVAPAVGLARLMAGALAFRLRVHDSIGFLVGDATLLGLAVATAIIPLGESRPRLGLIAEKRITVTVSSSVTSRL